MTAPRAVLHNVQIQTLPRRLTRPVSSETAVSEPSGTAESSAQYSSRKEHQGPSAAPLSRTAELQALDAAQQQGQQMGYELGYQEGLEHARREAQEQVAKLAQELAKKQVDEAFSRAEQQAQKHVQHLQAQLQQQFDRITTLSQQLPAQLVQYLQDAEDDMLALVYEVVCRILGDEAASLPGLRAQLQLCLKAWNGRAMLSVHIHPEDMDLLQSDEGSQKMLKSAGFSIEKSSLRWVSDPQINLGGCQLRSAEGELDARLEVQLHALTNSLLKTRAARKNLPTHTPLERAP